MIIEFDIIFTRKITNPTPPNYELNYYNVRNNAWEFLIKNKVERFPLNLQNLANNNNWVIFSYKQFCKLQGINENDLIKKYPDGFTVKTKNAPRYIICYNENNIKQRNRFTICHEFGHIILQHIYNKTNKLETEANMFAARILMPMLLIKEFNLENAQSLMNIFDVSIEAATHRLSRYNEIKHRNMFYNNPIEKRLYNQLKPFINKTKENLCHTKSKNKKMANTE